MESTTRKQCEPLFSTYHPPGSQRRRHASATSSPPVASHIKPGDFSSTLARMLFLPRSWIGPLDKRVSRCTIIIPQVFSLREGPSHLHKTGVGQKESGQTGVAVKTSFSTSLVNLYWSLRFQSVCIQEIFLTRCSPCCTFVFSLRVLYCFQNKFEIKEGIFLRGHFLYNHH